MQSESTPGALPQTLLENLLENLQGALTAWGPKVLAALAILVVGYFGAKIVAALFAKGLKQAHFDETLVRFLKNIVYMLILAFVAIAALSKLGFDTTSLAAIFAAAGLAIGFALQGSLGSFASGVMLIALRPFKVGDLVEVAGVTGVVEEVSVFATTLNTTDNTKIIVPNGEITAGNISNYTANDARRLDMVFGIGYTDDIRKAKEVFMRVLKEEPLVLDTPAPQVALSELADSSVNFVVRPWVKPEHYWKAWFAITEKIKLECDANGLSIPYPQQDTHIHQVNAA